MKILNLRLKNLNSLEGEWKIDFTHRDLVNDGIFAVIGKTGSGKTTILDAICLALYGHTPRLGSITTSANEIMSRRKGDCFAEVEFAVGEKVYRCHWSQKKARNSPRGRLQSAHHEISDLTESGKILGDKVSEVPGIVEEVSGLSYKQFIRSVMLAQGSFAAFLKAESNEKAEILEQITATEIYSQISIKVFEKEKEERLRLASLKDRLEMLTDDDAMKEPDVRKSLNEKKKELKTLDNRLNYCRKIESWDKSRIEFLDRCGMISQLEKEKADSSTLFKKEENNLKEVTQKQEVELKKIRKAFEKDNEIKGKKDTLKTEQARLENAEEKLKKAESDVAKAKKDLEKTEEDLKETEIFLQKNEQDGELIKDFSRMELTLSGLLDREWERKVKAQELADGKKNLKAQETLKNRAAEEFAKALETSEQAEEEYQKAAAELEKILEGTGLSELRNKREEQRDRKTSLEFMARESSRVRKISDDISKHETHLVKLREEKETGEDGVSSLKTKLNVREKEIERLEKIVALNDRIMSLEERRRELVKGEACPLCGSREHPFTNYENLPDEDEDRKALKEVKDAGKILQISLTELTAALKETDAGIKHHLDRLNELKQEKEDSTKDFRGKAEKLELKIEPIRDDDELEEMLNATKSELSKLTHKIKLAERAEKSLDQKRDERDSSEGKKVKSEKKKMEAEAAFSNAQTLIKQLEEELEESTDRMEKNRLEAESDLLLYGYERLELIDVPAIIEQLKNRMEAYEEKKAQKITLEGRVTEFKSRISESGRLVRQFEEDKTGQEEIIREMKTLISSLVDERRDFFGDRDPQTEEDRLADELKKARKSHDSARDLMTKADTNLKGAETEKDRTFTELKELLQKLKSSRKSLGITSEESSALFAKVMTGRDETFNQLNEDIRILNGEIGAHKNELKRLDELKNQVSALKLQLSKQEEKYGLYQKLYKLIGSADGKKFRQIAQEFTFRILTNYANSHLKSMSSRYELTPGPNFSLDVIDNYQGGERRTTQNLSGGETFIVSLALALGLSDMAGEKAVISSLFLDEGFGTLDENALESALATLSTLQGKGKLIGIISHVPSLKERIASNIRVIPVREGMSKLEGNCVTFRGG